MDDVTYQQEQRLYECRKLNSQFDELLRSNNLLPKLTDHQNRNRISKVERNRLLDVKRNAMQAQNRQSRKLLRLNESRDEAGGSEDETDTVDLHDLDFRLSKGTDGSLASGAVLTAGDTTLLSLLVASGLYPNCAIADANNHVRKQSEQVFHTKAKPIVALHPSSVYYSNTEFLSATTASGGGSINSTGHEPSGSQQKGHSPDLFFYGSLIETSKPYLCNVMKIPALPTLLLVAKSIDTNVSCDQLLIDDWLLVTLGANRNAVEMLCVAMELRRCWAQLVAKRLSHIFATENEGVNGARTEGLESATTPRNDKYADKSRVAIHLRAIGAPTALATYIEGEQSAGGSKNSTAESVGEGLVKFMHTRVRYSLARAKQSELPSLMVWEEAEGTSNEASADGTKGHAPQSTATSVASGQSTISESGLSELAPGDVSGRASVNEAELYGGPATADENIGATSQVRNERSKGGVALSENIRIGSFKGASVDIGC